MEHFGGGEWIRTIEAEAADLQSVPFVHSGTPPYRSQPAAALSVRLELAKGLEPSTG